MPKMGAKKGNLLLISCLSVLSYVAAVIRFGVWLFIKTELEQGSDKPLFYAVLGIPVDMPVFNGSDSDTLLSLIHI